LYKILQLDRIFESRESFLLSYPSNDLNRAKIVLDELEEMGVSELIFMGRHQIDGIPILGKGHVGIVLTASIEENLVAVKIKRADADRISLEVEGEYLKIANGVSVGPQLIDVSQNVLVMELVEGVYLIDWVQGLESSDNGLLKAVLLDLFNQARRLDMIGLDHGELSRASRHIIITQDCATIIDFESASISRRCSNVTSLAQYIFFNQGMVNELSKLIPVPDRDSMIGALSAYKWWPREPSFQRVLQASTLIE
jgi:putative serine/threonine protein kinase